MSTKASSCGHPLPPIPWFDIDLNLPEVTVLEGPDGERQWKLATMLDDAERNAWAPTAAGGLGEERASC